MAGEHGVLDEQGAAVFGFEGAEVGEAVAGVDREGATVVVCRDGALVDEFQLVGADLAVTADGIIGVGKGGGGGLAVDAIVSAAIEVDFPSPAQREAAASGDEVGEVAGGVEMDLAGVVQGSAHGGGGGVVLVMIAISSSSSYDILPN